MFINMDLFYYVKNESKDFNRKLLFLIAGSGLTNALILIAINTGAQYSEKLNSSIKYLVLFIFSIILYYFTQKKYFLKLNVITESFIAKIRESLCNKMRQGDYHSIEQFGESYLISRITKETENIGRATAQIILGLESMILIVAGMLYILYLSTTAFILNIIISAIGISVYFYYDKIFVKKYEKSIQMETNLYKIILHMFKGFKEIKINSKKNNDIFSDFLTTSQSAKDNKIDAGNIFNDNRIY
ncbi:hypothetical protein KA977_11915, partial [Candidatus Dependentiae bacterium]|nr:hypothetical protein [Candidatus Dependentiae bacterium]